MPEFALLKSGVFQRFEHADTRPENIPHKAFEWLPVVREYGQPFEGTQGDAYVIRTVDPATLPPPVPQSVSPRQARLALLAAGKLADANAAVAAADDATKIAWEFSKEIVRTDPGVIGLGAAVGLDAAALDDLFRAASKF